MANPFQYDAELKPSQLVNRKQETRDVRSDQPFSKRRAGYGLGALAERILRHAPGSFVLRGIGGSVQRHECHIQCTSAGRTMAVSPRLPKHLRDVLGPDAGEELVLILDQMRSQHADLRADMRADFAEFRREMQAQFHALEARLDARFARIDERFTALDSRVADVKSDLMKWSFVFWCGSVTAIALLARVLER